MDARFDLVQVAAYEQESPKDTCVERHNMSPAHVEILGQFLDQTALNPTQFMQFLCLGVDCVNHMPVHRLPWAGMDAWRIIGERDKIRD